MEGASPSQLPTETAPGARDVAHLTRQWLRVSISLGHLSDLLLRKNGCNELGDLKRDALSESELVRVVEEQVESRRASLGFL